MNLINFIRMLAPFADVDKKDIQVYDLSTDEGLLGYNNQLDELEKASMDVLNSFGINGKEWISGMRKLGQQIHDQNIKEQKKEAKSNQNDVVKTSVKQMENKEEIKKEFKRPSSLLTTDQNLKLHKIVQEYIDTMIKPFNDGVLTKEQINDAYAGLFEFAAWIMNR